MFFDKKKATGFIVLVILSILFLYSFLSRIWVTEDAYITFRHILNFFNGYGLTFNINQRIEGFTHPLWTILLLIISKIGFSIHFSSLLLGCIFTILGMVFLFYKFIYQENKLEFFYKSILIIPLLFIIHDGFRDFWTSGMEFSLTFFLIITFLYFNANKELENPKLNSILFSLLYLTRPELGLYFIYYGIIYLIQEYKKNKSYFNLIKNEFIYLFPFSLIVGGYHIFRFFYYQDIFPTTFYAKSSEFLWKEGLMYLLHTIYYSPLLIIFLIILILIMFYTKDINYYFIRELGVVIIHSIYIVSVGGDFMAYRLLLPDLIILYVYFNIIINDFIKKYNFKNLYVYITNIILFIISIVYLFHLKYHTPVEKFLIVHEYRAYLSKNQSWKDRWFYIDHKWYHRGLIFNELQKCLEYEPFIITNSWLDAKCAPEDDYGLGYFGYAAGSKVIIIDHLGITDKEVALTGKTIWKRVGHLKSISTENVIKRKVLFCNLQNKEYDFIMMTNFFPVISLDKEFLFRLGSQYPEKINKLKNLYKRLTDNSINEKDKKLLYYLRLMEKVYNQKIMDLPDINPHFYKKYDKCWDLKMNNVNLFYLYD